MMNEKENHYETPQKEGENEGFEKSSDNNYPKDLTEWKKKRESTYRVFCILAIFVGSEFSLIVPCLLYTSPSPRDGLLSRMPSSA